MCLAVPVQVLAINGEEAEVDFGGVRRRISVVLTPDACIGDYVVLHTGFAISIMDQEEAQQTLKLLQELEAFAAEQEQETNIPGEQSVEIR